MAKMFYSMEEVQEKLVCTEDKIKEYVKDGMLREFRDGMKILFKVDEVDSLSSTINGDVPVMDDEPLGGGDDDLLAGADGIDLDGSSIGIGLAPMDSEAGSSAIDNSPVIDDEPLGGGDDDLLAGADGIDLDGSSIGIGLASTGSSYGLADSSAEDDGIDLAGESADAYDLGSDDSVGLADAVSVDDSQLSNDKDDTVVTSHGIDALEDTEMDMDVDPLAQTKISSPLTDGDEISLDPSSSGSGLLDLSREADDTSLGADILKDIYSDEGVLGDDDDAPVLQSAVEEDEESIAEDDDAGMSFDEPMVSAEPAGAGMPAGGMAVAARRPQIYDPTSGAFGVMLIVPFIMLIYMIVNTCAFVSGTKPSALSGINGNMMYVTIGTGVLCLLIAIYGFFLAGNTSSKPAKVKAERAPKAKKEKKAKKTKKTRKK